MKTLAVVPRMFDANKVTVMLTFSSITALYDVIVSSIIGERFMLTHSKDNAVAE